MRTTLYKGMASPAESHERGHLVERLLSREDGGRPDFVSLLGHLWRGQRISVTVSVPVVPAQCDSPREWYLFVHHAVKDRVEELHHGALALILVDQRESGSEWF